MKNCFGEKLKVKHILSRNYYFDTTRMSYKTYTYSRVRDFWPNPSGKVPPKELELKFLHSSKGNSSRFD